MASKNGTVYWKLLELHHSLGPYRSNWDGLNAELYDCNPISDGDFVENLLKHFGEGCERLCVHQCKDGVDGMLILKPGRWGEWIVFLPAQSQLGSLLLRDGKMLQYIWPALPWMTCSLVFLCQDPLFCPLVSMDDGLPLLTVDHNRTMSIRLEGDFPSYWASRSHNLRKTTRNRFHRVERLGLPLRFIVREDPVYMAGCVARYAFLESTG